MKKRKQEKGSAPRKLQIGTITPEDFAVGRPYWGRRAHGHRKEPVPTLKPLPEDIVNKLLEAPEDELPPEDDFTTRSGFDYFASIISPTFDFGAGSDLDLGVPDSPPEPYVMRQYALSHRKGRKHAMLFVYGDVDKKNASFRIYVMVGDLEGYNKYEQSIPGRERMNNRVRQLDTLFSRGQWNDDTRKEFERLGPWSLPHERILFDREGNPR